MGGQWTPIDGSSMGMDGGWQWTAMDGATATQWRWTRQQWTARDRSTVTRRGWTTRNRVSATAMDRERNGDGQRWTVRWQVDGDGRCNGNSTARDGAMATQWRWMNSESATAVLARLVVGATKANTASKHKM